MSKVNEGQGLFRDHPHDKSYRLSATRSKSVGIVLTKEDPGKECMRIIPVLAVLANIHK